MVFYMFHYSKTPYIICTLFANFIYNEYIRPYFFIAHCFYDFREWPPQVLEACGILEFNLGLALEASVFCTWNVIFKDGHFRWCTKLGNTDLEPLHTRAKSRDHEFVRAQKKVSKGRPNTPPKSSSVVTDPLVSCEVICNRALNQMLFQWISIHAGPHIW